LGLTGLDLLACLDLLVCLSTHAGKKGGKEKGITKWYKKM
jgi:hypothetical protein